MTAPLKIRGGAGFYSCCSMMLTDIVHNYNEHGVAPDDIDSSESFLVYARGWVGPDFAAAASAAGGRPDNHLDFFAAPSGEIDVPRGVQFHWNDQWHLGLDFASLAPFIQKYFSPNDEVRECMRAIREKYCIAPSEVCVIFYRGNDKATEVTPTPYAEMFSAARRTGAMRFWVQSDESEFLSAALAEFGEHAFVCWDEIRHIPCDPTKTVDLLGLDNHRFAKLFLAIMNLMAECASVVCPRGNCSLWVALFRGGAHGVIQL